MKKSHFLIAGAAILAAGGIATYIYLRNVALKVSSPLGSAQIVPEATIMATFFYPNQQALTNLQQFGTPEARKLISQGYAEFQQENFAQTSIDWEKDLKPWLGGVMLAVVPGETGQDREPVNILMVVGIKNKLEALKFASKLKGEGEAKIIERQYQGVKYQEVTDESGKTFNATILGDYLVIAPVAAAVEDAIDTFQGQASLAMRKDAAESLQQSVGVKNAIATIFVPNYSQLMTTFVDDLPEKDKLPAATREQLQQVDSLVMRIGVDDGGVRLRAVTKLNSALLPVEQTQPVSGEVLQRFPAETMMLISGMGISKTWSQFVAQAQEDRNLQEILDTVRKTFQSVDWDADREVFSWMDGEFAVGLIPSNQGILAQSGVGGAVVLDTSDRSTAEQVLQKLNMMAIENAGVAIKEKKVDGKAVIEWQMPSLGTFLGYGWLDDDSLFVAFGEPLIEMMTTMPENSLISSKGFEEIAGSLPVPNQGYFYLDMEQAMALVNRYPVAYITIPQDIRAIFGSIRGIGMTGSWSDDLTWEMEILLALKSQD